MGSAMTVVAIAGMHRSGTSLLARAVNLLGVDLGPDRHLLPPTDDNPVGYWEDNRIVQLDDQLLGFLDGWWHRPPPLPEEWQYDWRLEPFRVWGAQIMADRADTTGPWGFKDPRLSLLLPFWRTVVDIDRTITGVRHPVEVCASVERRDGFSTEWAAHLWLRYTASAVVADPDGLVVRYGDWFADLDATAGAVADHLGLGPVSGPVRAAIAEHCDPALRRNRAADAVPEVPLLSRAIELWEALRTGPAADAVDAANDVLNDVEHAPADGPD